MEPRDLRPLLRGTVDGHAVPVPGRPGLVVGLRVLPPDVYESARLRADAWALARARAGDDPPPARRRLRYQLEVLILALTDPTTGRLVSRSADDLGRRLDPATVDALYRAAADRAMAVAPPFAALSKAELRQVFGPDPSDETSITLGDQVERFRAFHAVGLAAMYGRPAAEVHEIQVVAFHFRWLRQASELGVLGPACPLLGARAPGAAGA